jgi:transposase
VTQAGAMPWKVSSPVSERLKFIKRLQDGERVVDLCNEFGISRKTAYKLKARFEESGPAGLYDRSRAPLRIPRRTPPEIEALVLEARAKHQNRGPVTLRESLMRTHPGVRILMQLMPYTARRVGIADRHLFDPARNILGGVRLLAVLLRHYDGDVVSALVAYNARPRRLLAPIPRNGETPMYVWRVLARARNVSASRLEATRAVPHRSSPTAPSPERRESPPMRGAR